MINDYFDFDLDQFSGNKHKSGLNKQVLFYSSIASVILGFCISVWIATSTGLLHLLWIYPISAVALFLYSKFLKSQGLPGNLIVALFTAGVIAVILLSEQDISFSQNEKIESVLYSFMIFSFLINLYREIIKDIEDIIDDKAFGYKTLAVKIGPTKAGLTAFFIGVILLILIILFGLILTFTTIQKAYVIGMLAIPWIIVLYLNHRANNSSDYHRISQLCKGIMLFGLVYLFLV